VQVTVVPDGGRRRRHRLIASGGPLRRGLLIGGLAAAALVATVGIAARPGGRARSASTVGVAGARIAGPAGVAAAYRYPLSCLTVKVADHDAYARAWLDRASPCWRYGAYVTAIFHRVDGTWRIVLDTATYSCPVRSLPTVVQAQLSVCTTPRSRVISRVSPSSGSGAYGVS
jgi:hypothetical protein